MDLRIYQINRDRDAERIAFESLDLLEQYTGSRVPDSSIYDLAYEGAVEAGSLEDVYRIFNQEHPAGYAGRSLSVSDIVEVVHAPEVEPGFYFCDSIGFKQVAFEPEKAGKVRATMQVVLLEPGKEARITEIGTGLAALQRVVGGDIQAIYPFEEEVALVCNDEGKINGMALNRAVYSEPRKEEMSYHELVSRFRAAEREGRHETGYIVFTEDSFTEPYPLAARTYEVSSNNKAFQPGMGGYSIYASAIDGSDSMVRLEGYMAAEHGGENGWKVESCYQLQQSREIVDIIAGTCFLCSCEGSNFGSLSDEQAKRYAKLFRYPERFVRDGEEIRAIPYNPKGKSQERVASI